MKPLKKYIIIILVIFVVVIFMHFKRYQKLFSPNEELTESDSDNSDNIYLLSVSDYTQWVKDFQSDIADTFIGYELGSNKIVPWQQELAQSYVDVYNTNYNTSFTRSTLPPLTAKFIQNLPTTPVTLGPDDPINVVMPLFTSFVPDVPPSLSFYSYKPVDVSQSFYIKNSSRVQKLKDCVDLALSLNTPFYVNADVINKLDLDKNSYALTIAQIPLDYFIRPVNYTYFDPLDIYVHPTRYTLNKGVGIMDTTQPNYTLFVEKNQLASLNRLLNVSGVDTPMIHAFFELPDYTVEWDDAWRNNLFTQYDLYISKKMTTTQAFQQAIIDTLKTFTKTTLSSLDYTNPSKYFSLLPSNLYWVIILLSLFDPSASDTQNKLLLQRLVNAGYNPQDCYNYCDREQSVCYDESQAATLACQLACGHPSPEACEDNCRTLLSSLNNVCGLDNQACKTKCLTNDNLPSNCSESSSTCACGRMSAASYEPTICCPSGKTDFFMAYNYCYGMEDGSTCWTDAMCKSGYCTGSDVLLRMKGQCVTKM